MKKDWVEYYSLRSKKFNDRNDIAEIKLDTKFKTRNFLINEKKRLLNILQPKEKSTLYDFGCNVGVISELLSNKFDTIIGLDLSKDCLKLASEAIENGKFYCCDLEKLDPKIVKNLKYGICYGVLHYLKDTQVCNKFIKKLSELSQPGAKIIFSRIPNLKHKKNYLKFKKIKESENSWIFYDPNYFIENFSDHFQVIPILPIESISYPFLAFFELILIKK